VVKYLYYVNIGKKCLIYILFICLDIFNDMNNVLNLYTKLPIMII
jgi:hypothetical protein